MDSLGRLSNLDSSSESPAYQGFSVSIRSRSKISNDTENGNNDTLSVWLEVKGQLSNPHSKLNEKVDLITRGLEEVKHQPLREQRARQTKHQPLRNLTEQEVYRLASRYREGVSVQALAAEFNIHRTTVLNHLERRQVSRRRNERKMTDELVDEAAELYRAGASLAKLGRRYDVDPQTVSRELKKVGVVMRAASRWNR